MRQSPGHSLTRAGQPGVRDASGLRGDPAYPAIVDDVAAETSTDTVQAWFQRFAPFAAGFFAVVIAAMLAWPLLPRRYEASASIVLLPDKNNDPSSSTRPLQPAPDDNAIQSDVDFIASPALAKIVIATNGLMTDPEFAAPPGFAGTLATFAPVLAPLLPPRQPPAESIVRARLQARLKVSRDRRSYTVTFGYWSADPVKAATLTTSLLSLYMAAQGDRKRDAVRRTTGWLDERVALLRSQYQSADAAVRSFLETSNLIDTGAQASLDHQLNMLSTAMAQAKAQVVETTTRAAMLQAMQAAKTIENAPDILLSPAIQKLKEARAAALAKPGIWAPEAQAIDDQLGAESARIVAGAVAESREWIERTSRLDAEVRSVRAEMTARTRAQLHLEDLQRDAKATKSVLEETLVRLNNQTSLLRAVAPDVEVIAEPEPPLTAAFPNPLLGFIGTLLAACLTGAVTMWRAPLLARVFA
ncbi:hypothetical protein [Beijerinckia sp. L45]|uniref:GumC family protein n=1 Tax=Beijerinckia sp. L45 TaxID=1641855 RepID=UPI00131DB4AB|nr:hypothetical protein [Beijerinckia sp. L45]